MGIQKKDWDKLKDRLPKTHVWEYYFARREGRRGKSGGFIIRKRNGFLRIS